MGSGPIKSMVPDLFSMPHREHAALPPNPKPTADKAASSPRHVLPSDLSAAIKHLNDQELDQLQAAVTTELKRRGKKPPLSDKTPSKRVEAATVSLPPVKLNAVLAAFKAGVRPSKIAKQFGIPQSDVRKALASDKPKL
jgi:DNA-directed RNA polymerase specialized sigma24 family protein